jgi:hypothetical protein
MDAETKSAWRAVVLAVLALLVGAYSVLYGLQTLTFWSAHIWQGKYPELSRLPEPLPPTTDGSSGRGTKVTPFGYQFEAPWADLGNMVPGPGYESFEFRSGQRIVLFDPTAQTDTVRAMNTASPEQFRRSSIAFAGVTFDSNYALYDSVFAASPAQLSAFMPLGDSVRARALLLWKESLATNTDTGFYSFELGRVRGFQRGDPSRARYVVLRAFDARDHQFEFIFAARPDATVQLTQSDINHVLETLKPEWEPGG